MTRSTIHSLLRLPTPGSVADRNLSELASRRLADRGHQPYVTYYDDATGERTELSYATADNWASKTANLLVEELGTIRGDRVGFAIDGHWAAVVVAIACAKVGAVAVAVDAGGIGSTTADVGFAHESVLDSLAASAIRTDDIWAVGDGMGGALSGSGGIARSFSREVPAFGDDYDDPAVEASDVLLDTAGGGITQAQFMAAGGRLREGRLLLDASADQAVMVAVALTVFCQGGSFVAVRHLDADRLVGKLASEQVAWALLDDDVTAGAGSESDGFRGFASLDDLLADR